MATRFFCSTCGTQLEVDDSLVGSKVRCGNCGDETRAPAARLSMPNAAAPGPTPGARPAELAPAPTQPVTRSDSTPSSTEEELLGLADDDDLRPKSAAPAARPLASGRPLGQAGPGAAVPQGMPVGKPVQPAKGVPAVTAAAPTNPAAQRQAPPAAGQAAAKSEEESYELVYDDLPSKSTAPAGRPITPGLPVGQPIPSATIPHGLPVGKPVQTKKTPQGPPVGKPVQPTRNVPAAAAAAESAAADPGARLTDEPKSPENVAPEPAVPQAPVGKPVQPASRASRHAPAAAPAIDSLPDVILPDVVLPDVIGDEFSHSALTAEFIPIGRLCPACLSRLAKDSNICPTCGRDSTASEPIPQELPAEPPGMHGRKGMPSAKGEMRSVRLGLYGVCVAQVLVLIAVLLQLVATLGDQPLQLDAPSPLALVTVICAGLGFLCSCVSSVLCLIVPKRTGARGMIFLKNACDAGTIALVAAYVQNQLPAKATLLIAVLPVVSILLFILFMKKLAVHLGRDDFARDVQRLLWKTLAFVGAVGLCSLFSAMVGSETFMLARVVGVVGWSYILFQFTLVAQQLAAAVRTGLSLAR